MRKEPFPSALRDARGRWDLAGARTLQTEMRDRVETDDRLGPVRCVAGADVAYDRRGSVLYACVVVLDASSLEILEAVPHRSAVSFPYVPGFLSFREAPPILDAFGKLRVAPDLLFVDGHGQAHPRRFGIACHLGLLLDLPTIGVAKSILVGKAASPGSERGASAPLVHEGERVGTVLRTRDRVAPVIVSVGHRISLETATRWVLACGAGYRLPEPARRAHLTVEAFRAGRHPVGA